MAVKKLNNYEMMIALKPLLPDDLRKQMHKEFVESIKKFGGDVLDVDVWGKRYLAYPIKNHNEAYYIVYDFTVSPENIAEIKRQMQLKQEVLRFMIVSMDDTSGIGKGIKKKEIEI
ncbi:MAG TPA: 30S ribosomal protein S6 [Candidatus Dojkabacteria bacterium]|jgi:small subunit ribosomal protein S6|nr:30S ribosomal protein S6 [Candidatus Dojkabacteria bacterium]